MIYVNASNVTTNVMNCSSELLIVNTQMCYSGDKHSAGSHSASAGGRVDFMTNNRQRKNSVAEFLWCVTKIKVAVILTPSFSERFIFFFIQKVFVLNVKGILSLSSKKKREKSLFCAL